MHWMMTMMIYLVEAASRASSQRVKEAILYQTATAY